MNLQSVLRTTLQENCKPCTTLAVSLIDPVTCAPVDLSAGQAALAEAILGLTTLLSEINNKLDVLISQPQEWIEMGTICYEE